MNFWMSWWLTIDDAFEMRQPWWVDAQRSNGDTAIVAAIKATSIAEAKRIIRDSYKTNPRQPIEFRFIEQCSDDWSPFGLRYHRAEWMQWSSDPITAD